MSRDPKTSTGRLETQISVLECIVYSAPRIPLYPGSRLFDGPISTVKRFRASTVRDDQVCTTCAVGKFYDPTIDTVGREKDFELFDLKLTKKVITKIYSTFCRLK